MNGAHFSIYLFGEKYWASKENRSRFALHFILCTLKLFNFILHFRPSSENAQLWHFSAAQLCFSFALFYTMKKNWNWIGYAIVILKEKNRIEWTDATTKSEQWQLNSNDYETNNHLSWAKVFTGNSNSQQPAREQRENEKEIDDDTRNKLTHSLFSVKSIESPE